MKINEAVTTPEGHGNIMGEWFSDWHTQIGYLVRLSNGRVVKCHFNDIKTSARNTYIPNRVNYLIEKYEDLKKETKKDYEYLFNLIINDLKEL